MIRIILKDGRQITEDSFVPVFSTYEIKNITLEEMIMRGWNIVGGEVVTVKEESCQAQE